MEKHVWTTVKNSGTNHHGPLTRGALDNLAMLQAITKLCANFISNVELLHCHIGPELWAIQVEERRTHCFSNAHQLLVVRFRWSWGGFMDLLPSKAAKLLRVSILEDTSSTCTIKMEKEFHSVHQEGTNPNDDALIPVPFASMDPLPVFEPTHCHAHFFPRIKVGDVGLLNATMVGKGALQVEGLHSCSSFSKRLSTLCFKFISICILQIILTISTNAVSASLSTIPLHRCPTCCLIPCSHMAKEPPASILISPHPVLSPLH
mmetsp:Transcript_9298/g.16424  ORF Transcript_9298/g.16424 Transcript_9298/m.16424 type:complete len:262 (+) Transcript_9298:2054-2839(+)